MRSIHGAEKARVKKLLAEPMPEITRKTLRKR
jgi:hypothetical protein